MGRDFRWLWLSYAVSTAGTRLAFDAFPLVAVLVLHASATEVSLLSSAGLAVGVLLAVPIGPWVEARRKRSVMIGMDLVRFLVLLTVPAAYLVGALTFVHLVVVSVVVAVAGTAFTSASGACLKSLVPPEKLLAANGRFEATSWTATALGPPAGGLAIAVFGPLLTVVVDAVSHLLSAAGLRAIRGREPEPVFRRARPDVGDGWRHILRHPLLRPIFLNSSLVNGLIMATAPLLLVLLVGELGFTTWQYGLALGLPCLAGLVGARLVSPLVTRFGERRVLWVSGAARVCWPVGLAFVPAGAWGVVVVIAVQSGLITCISVFNPLSATYRLRHTPDDRVARVLAAWTVSGRAVIATLTLLWGLLAGLVGARVAIGLAGVFLLCTPVLLARLPD